MVPLQNSQLRVPENRNCFRCLQPGHVTPTRNYPAIGQNLTGGQDGMQRINAVTEMCNTPSVNVSESHNIMQSACVNVVNAQQSAKNENVMHE